MSGPELAPADRPTLSVCILAWNGERRLPATLRSVQSFADEIVVGVDADSSDGTLDLARAEADRVFLFEHPGTPEPPRLLVLEQASSDWILLLDDDERMEPTFEPLLPELLSDDRYTHYAFPRKWIVPGRAGHYVRALPWFPDWQVRLFRNDRRLVWHAPGSHSGYQVIGVGCREDRAALVHYERTLLGEVERRLKVARYRVLGGEGRFEEFYLPFPAAASAPLEVPMADPPPRSRARAGVLDPTVHAVVGRSALPPWGARLEVRLPSRPSAGERVVVSVDAFNTGTLRWIPPALEWPRLFLSYHLRRADGEVLAWDGERTPLGRMVEPGESATFLPFLDVPSEPGDYILEWDVVSEGECWFSECGSPTTSVHLRVSASTRPGRPRVQPAAEAPA